MSYRMTMELLNKELAAARERGFRDGYLRQAFCAPYPPGRLCDEYAAGYEEGSKSFGDLKDRPAKLLNKETP